MSEKTSKFPKNVPMTIDEVAAVVGDEFKEMNENPPPEVIKLREEMQAKQAAASGPGGKYGYTKLVERMADVTSRKLARHAVRVAKRIFAKDESVVGFLQAHAKRERSKSATVLLKAMAELGPKVANTKTAKTSTDQWGLYGFKQKTADLGLSACNEIRLSAGRLASDMHRRKADMHDKFTGFLKAHAKTAACPYAGILLSCYPDASIRFASGAKNVKLFPDRAGVVPGPDGRSGIVLGFEVVPQYARAFLADVRKKADGQIRVKLGGTSDVTLSGNEVDGQVAVMASWPGGREVNILPFTAYVKEGPRMVALASGDFIEWED